MTFKSNIDWQKEVPKLKELGSMGQSMVTISKKYGVTRQRIKQVIDKFIPEWHDVYGRAVNRKERADARYTKWGVKEDTELYESKRKKFRGKKANAVRRGVEWSLDFGVLDWPTHCPILGIELDYFAEKANEGSLSFDRINPKLGYVNGNVQIISWRANRLKNDGTAAELRAIADYLDNKKVAVSL